MTDRSSRPHWFVRASYCPGVYSDPAKALSTLDNLTPAHVVQYTSQAHAVHALRVAIKERTLVCHPIPKPVTPQIRRVVVSDKGSMHPYVVVLRGYTPGVYEDADSALCVNDHGGEFQFVRVTTKSQAIDIWREAIEADKVVATSRTVQTELASHEVVLHEHKPVDSRIPTVPNTFATDITTYAFYPGPPIPLFPIIIPDSP